MEPGEIVDRLKRQLGAEAIPELDDFDPRNDLHLDQAASLLLQRFHGQNDAGALATVFELSHGRLVDIARQITARFALAIDPDDLVAAFMTRLFVDVRRPQPVIRRFLGLAHTSMRNDALNQLRQHSRSLRRMLQFQAGLGGPVDPAREAADREQTRAFHRVGLTLLAVVSEAFHSLKERDRRVLLAREIDRMSYADVARMLSIPDNQIGMVIQRARKRLAKRIARSLSNGEEVSS